MSTADKFFLSWNDFKENINNAFISLRNDTDFTDITLACEDGNHVEAHKVILASSSPFFLNLLKRHKNPHPILYMRGMKSEDLVAILDFLYYGEANIDHANLDNFLRIVDELQLKGLNIEKGNEDPLDDNIPIQTSPSTVVTEAHHINEGTVGTMKTVQEPSFDYQPDSKSKISFDVPVTKQEFSGNIQKLNEEIETMIGRGEKMVKFGSRLRNGEWRMGKSYICKVCGKEGKRTHIMNHIEASHLNGVIIPCNPCKKAFRTRDSLRNHISRCHKNKKMSSKETD